jgi:hypothetical protein
MTMMMKTRAIVTLALFASAAAVPAAAAEPAGAFLTPTVKPGDELGSVFAKTVAITGKGFEPLVRRVSGSASDTIVAVTDAAITEAETYAYDGISSGSDTVVVRDHGVTNCVDGACATNTSTSAPLFDPLLWGAVPAEIAIGSSWNAPIADAWEIGPPGTELVTVERLEPAIGLITLTRVGHGTGLSADDTRKSDVTIVSEGRSITVHVKPGPATWRGKATFRHGVTIADEIVVERPVDLVANTGQVFHGRERIYTLFVES